jgi:hypothetical protein
MACVECASNNEAKFSTEIAFHFSGMQGLDKPCIFVFPKVLVCLDCGFSRFTTPDTEIVALAKSVGRHEKPGNGDSARVPVGEQHRITSKCS